MAATGWWRKEGVFNSADPTTYVNWRWCWKKLDIRLTGIWEVESIVYWGHRKIYRGYNVWWSNKLFNFLEDRWQAQQPWNQPDYDWGWEDEIEEAERKAGWDPNP